MAGFLELTDLGEDEGVAEMEVGGRRIEAEFDPKRPARGDLLGKLLAGMNVGQTGEEGFGGHSVSLTALWGR